MLNKDIKFTKIEEAHEFLKNIESLFIFGDTGELIDEEIIMMANDIYKEKLKDSREE
ncbi:MAG: hypothetical protein ACRCX2_32485 [Paraclostridium sp.]